MSVGSQLYLETEFQYINHCILEVVLDSSKEGRSVGPLVRPERVNEPIMGENSRKGLRNSPPPMLQTRQQYSELSQNVTNDQFSRIVVRKDSFSSFLDGIFYHVCCLICGW